ncbi:putative tRNA-specific adenosine-34 deaminase subunit Tad3 [Aspergillus homomorphus CBS 101889]|uniref:Cytidine deaminase-like protein n=1 Tax=Aspergillus homomorphus (strain CBS 101889) TaxID=1450537 RepID=A0A395HYS9_ASPHC|nr:hypothetical protein BO97DRAFT_454283 [Aspergillus homomorphus CBS 101889]RAL11404.1 hypothetical protein BO97DRAFT_454283 [Aspergillus homomorphus CBS 101889]
MDAESILRGVQPLMGEVVPIRSVQETRPLEEYAEAYVAEVNVKTASKVIKALDSKFPRDSSHPQSHLRRFAKHNQIPESLRPTLLKQGYLPSQTIFVLVPPPLPAPEALQALLAPFAPPPREPPTTPQPTEPSSTTTSAPAPADTTPAASKITLHTITVPMQPPLTPPQAELWSSKMWPVVFNPAAPRALIAPPPQILSRVRDSINPKAGHYLALAQIVAAEAEQSGLGRGVGAVVVDPELEPEATDIDPQTEAAEGGSTWTDAIVAVAGDGRYSRREGGNPAQAELVGGGGGGGPNPNCGVYNADCEGGPELHALMRVVELISSKRREDQPGSRRQQIRPVLYGLEDYFLKKSDVAAKVEADDGGVGPRIRSRAQGGYLCNDLDVYFSHEPCICCCMGLLLSRFRAVIFPRRGRMVSGGLASEPVVKPVPVETEGGESTEASEDKEDDSEKTREYYGLHWRKELNWRALGFEFVAENDSTGESCAEKGVPFHA